VPAWLAAGISPEAGMISSMRVMSVLVDRLSSPKAEDLSAVERQAANRAVAAKLAVNDCSAASSRNARRVRSAMRAFLVPAL
jgi:hypothetical protein